MADDVAAMDALFHDAPTTVRYGVGEVLYGIDEIREFRKGRGGSPQRRLGRSQSPPTAPISPPPMPNSSAKTATGAAARARAGRASPMAGR
jgi:hypothetical protein